MNGVNRIYFNAFMLYKIYNNNQQQSLYKMLNWIML